MPQKTQSFLSGKDGNNAILVRAIGVIRFFQYATTDSVHAGLDLVRDETKRADRTIRAGEQEALMKMTHTKFQRLLNAAPPFSLESTQHLILPSGIDILRRKYKPIIPRCTSMSENVMSDPTSLATHQTLSLAANSFQP